MIDHLRNPLVVAEPPLDEFTEEEVRAILLVAQKQARTPFDPAAFVKAMEETAPVLVRPRITDRALDLWRMLSVPEILEELWPNWNGRVGARGPDPGYLAKALLVLTASLGISAHFDDNYEALMQAEGAGFRAVFESVERAGAAATGRKAQPFAAKTYEKACQQIGLITDPLRNPGRLTTEHCLAVNDQLCRTLREIYPEFGVRLGLDTMLVKAWVKQEPRRSPEDERRIRKRAPNATPRLIAGRDGSPKRFARGYYLAALVDLATGVPVSWNLYPAGEGYNDVRTLRYLLSDTFERWEDHPVTHLVADRAWNGSECVGYCATHYGIHLITGQDAPSLERHRTELSPYESDSIAGFDGRGLVYCRTHGAVMMRAGHDFVTPEKRRRSGLKPGEAVHNGGFRLRFVCPIGGEGCETKPHLHMRRDWNALSFYPHTMDAGRPDLHAFRLAMNARRNQCESLFGALKIGHKLGLEGADRTHTATEATVETLFSLALLLRTALVVAHERIQRGEMPDVPPADLAARI
jgi:hypothetical protein